MSFLIFLVVFHLLSTLFSFLAPKIPPRICNDLDLRIKKKQKYTFVASLRRPVLIDSLMASAAACNGDGGVVLRSWVGLYDLGVSWYDSETVCDVLLWLRLCCLVRVRWGLLVFCLWNSAGLGRLCMLRLRNCCAILLPFNVGFAGIYRVRLGARFCWECAENQWLGEEKKQSCCWIGMNLFLEICLQLACFWIHEVVTACVSLDMDRDKFYGQWIIIIRI